MNGTNAPPPPPMSRRSSRVRVPQLGKDLQPKSASTFALLSACTVAQDAGQRMIFVGALLLS